MGQREVLNKFLFQKSQRHIARLWLFFKIVFWRKSRLFVFWNNCHRFFSWRCSHAASPDLFPKSNISHPCKNSQRSHHLSQKVRWKWKTERSSTLLEREFSKWERIKSPCNKDIFCLHISFSYQELLQRVKVCKQWKVYYFKTENQSSGHNKYFHCSYNPFARKNHQLSQEVNCEVRNCKLKLELCVEYWRGALGEGVAHWRCVVRRVFLHSEKLHWHDASSLRGALGWSMAHRTPKPEIHQFIINFLNQLNTFAPNGMQVRCLCGVHLVLDFLGQNLMVFRMMLIYGKTMMKWYLNAPNATSKTLEEEGWLHTSVIGSIDSKKELFIVDRVKKLVKYQGFQVTIANIKGILRSHPFITDAAVTGEKHEVAGRYQLLLKLMESVANIVGYGFPGIKGEIFLQSYFY